MSKHIFTISHPASDTPATCLPDGVFTGNGDISVVLAGTADRIRLHISKADFWNADGRHAVKEHGGISPLGMVEILIPQLAYAEYQAEQNLDEAYIALHLTSGNFTADLKVTACATENTVIMELNRSFPVLSASVSLIPLDGWGAVTSHGKVDDVSYTVRGFDSEHCRFPSYGICALRRISREVKNGTERIVWAMQVCTNHDTAAYKYQAIERVSALQIADCEKLLTAHAVWWEAFWKKSSVTLADQQLELYWYAGLYAVACCMRNKKFPPGLWGNYITSDGMSWFGDYHLNYNFEAPFYALTSCNHTELIECYMAPLNDFLPMAKRYAREYLGIEGAFFPCGIGPFGLEADFRSFVKEHGHLFHGQKSNGAYAAVIPMMHWYGTRDTEFAKREYYDYLLSVAEFWENYLVFEDGAYQIYNDALNEVAWYAGPDQMPEGHDDKNPIVSRGLVQMIMKLMIDLSTALQLNTDKIPTWQHILDHLPMGDTFESEGKRLLRGIDGSEEVRELALEYIFPANAVGKYSTPELFEAAKNTHKRLNIWDSHNRFCSYYPMAARLEYPAKEIIGHIHDVINTRSLPNGMFRYAGGGIENSSAIPSTVNEMMLQSYEGIIRLFPVWDKSSDASFTGLRAKGAFVIDAKLENGSISAKIVSEQGQPFILEVPQGGYTLVREDGSQQKLAEGLHTVSTRKGEFITLYQ